MEFTLEASAVLDGTPSAVFDRLVDIERLPEWNDEIVRVVTAPATLQPGAQWVVELRALGTRWHSRSVASEVDPERGVFAHRSVSDDGNPSWADWRWQVTREGDGTRADVRVSAHPRTFWRKHLLSRIRRRSLERSLRRSLDALGRSLQHPALDQEAT